MMDDAETAPLPERIPTVPEQQDLALHLVRTIPSEQRDALVEWATEMLNIRGRGGSNLRKACAAIKATKSRRVLWPLLHRLYKSMRQLGWTVKLSVTLGGLVAVLLPGKGAGIAAFGGAVGVPLWVVFGAGGAFAGAIVDAAKAARQST